MRDQNGSDQAEHDRERDQGCQVVLIVGLEQGVFGIIRVDVNIDAGADRISGDCPQGEHPRRERRSANPDPVALDLLAPAR